MTNIHTETFGQGKPIALVHGWAMHSGIWRGFAQALAQDYRVTLVDLPGHGHSQPTLPFDLETICQTLVKTVGREPCCWLGWSLGAEIVIALAERFPNRVNQLVLLTGSPCFVQKGEWPGIQVDVLESFGESLVKDRQGTLLRFLSLQVKGDSASKNTLQVLKQAVFECPPQDQETLRQGLMLLKETDLRRTFAQLTIPVAAILGELDTLVPVAVGKRMQTLLPNMTLSVIPRAGHVPFLAHETNVLEAVRAVLTGRSCK